MFNARNKAGFPPGLLVMAIVLGLMYISSCKHELPEPPTTPGGNGGGTGGGGSTHPCDSDSVYFNAQVLPMLNSNCGMSGCHDAGSHQDGVVLTSYQDVMNSGIVVPGDPTDGDLMEVLLTNDPNDIMPPPPSSPLTSSQIQLVQTWIAQGAQNLTCNDCDSSAFTFNAVVKPIILSNCQGCHLGSNPGGGIILNSYNTISSAAFSGMLMGSIQHALGYAAMPPGGTLSACDIAVIRKWVDAGAPNN